MELRLSLKRTVLLFLSAVIANGYAQDTRTVLEPTLPASCSVLQAQLGIAAGEPTSETAFDTARIQSALNACAAGQAVELEAAGANDAFLIQPLTIPSGVTLLVDGGVTVFASRNPADYQTAGGETCGTVGTLGNGCSPLIGINGNAASTGAGVMGYGVIDGRGEDKLLVNGIASASSWWDVASQAQTANGSQNNPILLGANKANSFTLYKITFRNSPMFHVKWQGATGFTAWGVKVATPYTARNSDGIDPSGSDITITQSSISDGDDNIALSASSATSNITISSNNTYSGHGISIGSYTKGGLSNMLVTDINQAGTASDKNGNALRIKSAADRGGLVQNVAYRNICMQNHTTLIDIDPFYNSNSGSLIPQFSNITFTNIHGLTPGTIALQGFDSGHLTTVTFNNVVFDGLIPSNIKPAFQFDTIQVGPGPVEPGFLQTQGGTGVTYTGSTSTSGVSPYPCSAANFAYLVGDLYLLNGASTNGQPGTIEGPATVTLNAMLEPAMSQVTYGPYTGIAAPAAAVQFLEGSTVVGQANLMANGTLASLTLTGVAVGTHTYTAMYPGDSNYAAYAFGSATVVVVLTPTTSLTTLKSSVSSVQSGATTSLVATVTTAPSAAAATGVVSFYDGTTLLGSSQLSGPAPSTASFVAMLTGAGAHNVTAIYVGDTHNATSTSAALSIQVTAIPTSTVVSVSSGSVSEGANATILANVTSSEGVPTGTVTFLSGTTTLGTAPLVNGQASFTTTSSTLGTQTLSATYDASGNYAGSSSEALTLSFTAPFTLSAGQYAVTIAPGANATVAISATPATGFVGTIAFSCSSPVTYLTCAMMPASQTVAGASAVQSSIQLTLAPTISSLLTAPNVERDGRTQRIALAFLFPIGGLLLAGVRGGRRKLRAPHVILGLACFSAMLCMTGCGGSTTSKAPPAGLQVVTVTATSGATTQTLSITVEITK